MKQMLIHDIGFADAMLELSRDQRIERRLGADEYVDGSSAQPCRTWLSANFDRLGKESSVDVRAKYL